MREKGCPGLVDTHAKIRAVAISHAEAFGYKVQGEVVN